MAFQFRKHQRIKTPAEFQRVYRNKQWGNTRFLTFNVLAVDHGCQLGVTVSKKVSKKAVRRNQIKRIVREYFRHNQQGLDQAQVVITVKPSAREISNDDLRADLKELWGKLMKWQRWNAHQLKKSAVE